MCDLLGVVPICGSGRLQIAECCRGHAAGVEDIPRHALSTADANGLALCVGRHLKSIVDLGVIEILGIALERRDIVVGAVSIVRPAINDIALRAEHHPDVVVLVEGGSTSALDVVATDIHVGAVALRAWIRQIAGDLRRRAEYCLLLGAQQWIAAVDEIVPVSGLSVAANE